MSDLLWHIGAVLMGIGFIFAGIVNVYTGYHGLRDHYLGPPTRLEKPAPRQMAYWPRTSSWSNR